MASYAVGDIQGCFAEFCELLDTLDYQAEVDQLYLLGDLVNRGPDSLGMLRWAYTHRQYIQVVLGNHDLHLIAVHAGVAKTKRLDTLDAILQAPDADELMAWLRIQPLVVSDVDHLFVHAGISPDWTPEQALACSQEVQNALSGAAYVKFLRHMYGNEPNRWESRLKGWDRLRYIVNACTRTRVVGRDGHLDLAFKGELDDAPGDLVAWFDLPGRQTADVTVVCGHWSALGLRVRDNLLALDTGCVWGGQLTAVRLEDRRVFQVPSRQTATTDWS